jgi:hypothetical protein
MNLKDRIQDIFEQYSVYLDKHEDEEKKMDEHKDEKTEMAKKTLANGTTIYTDADAFAVGVDVFIVNEEGERMPLPDGEYEYEEGGKTVVADGKIAEMVEAEEDDKEKNMGGHEDDEEKKMDEHKDKEEMSYTLTESELSSMIAKAVGAAKEEFAKDMEATKDELSSMKEMLSSQRAEGGLRQSKANAKRMTFSDIKGLDAKDRVAAIHEIYSNQ